MDSITWHMPGMAGLAVPQPVGRQPFMSKFCGLPSRRSMTPPATGTDILVNVVPWPLCPVALDALLANFRSQRLVRETRQSRVSQRLTMLPMARPARGVGKRLVKCWPRHASLTGAAPNLGNRVARYTFRRR